jgi:hypothetical protein
MWLDELAPESALRVALGGRQRSIHRRSKPCAVGIARHSSAFYSTNRGGGRDGGWGASIRSSG